MFQKSCTFAPSNKKTTIVLLTLGYGVMVTQQILVLFFLVRIRVAQQEGAPSKSGHLFYVL